MNDQEWIMTMALNRCTMLPGSFQKRFVRDLAASYQASDKPLSDKQHAYLHKLYFLYRKQIQSSAFYNRDTYPAFEPIARP